MKRLDIPPLWLILAIAAALALAWLVPWPGSGPVVRLAGTALIALGLTLVVVSAREMRRARTPVTPRRTPSALVTGGPFALSRNPIYLGGALIVLGVCLLTGSALALVTVPAFIWVIARRFIGPEEARLRDTFGTDFAAWSARVRRWL